jgi:hypothetical protein
MEHVIPRDVHSYLLRARRAHLEPISRKPHLRDAYLVLAVELDPHLTTSRIARDYGISMSIAYKAVKGKGRYRLPRDQRP